MGRVGQSHSKRPALSVWVEIRPQLTSAPATTVPATSEGRIRFPAIAASNRAVLEAHIDRGPAAELQNLDDVLAADAWAREVAAGVVAAEAGRAA